MNELSGSPTLIRGPERVAIPQRPHRRCGGLLPLLWTASILIGIPWVLALHQTMTTSYMGPSSLDPAVSVRPVAVSHPTPVVSESTSADTDEILLTLRVPANRWVDTGIDMCGCANITLTTVGMWTTPDGSTVDADGVSGKSIDGLTTSASYGELIGKVDADPSAAIGTHRAVSGDQFNDSGTLKIGMNAGRLGNLDNASGELLVTIKGTGGLDHQPRFCASPR